MLDGSVGTNVSKVTAGRWTEDPVISVWTDDGIGQKGENE